MSACRASVGVMMVLVWCVAACDASGEAPDVAAAPHAVAPQGVEAEAALAATSPSDARGDEDATPGAGIAPSFEVVPRPALEVTADALWMWRVDARGEGVRAHQVVGVTAQGVEVACRLEARARMLTCEEQLTGVLAWRLELEDRFVGDGALLIHDQTLYVVHHSAIATGARAHAFALESGKLRWSRDLIARGEVWHSRYRNEVQLAAGEGQLVVYGKESSGGYVEALDLERGVARVHALIPREATITPLARLRAESRHEVFGERGQLLAVHVLERSR